jgi:uncharacterized membrane protein YbaN (DUF454 family)
MADNVQLIGGCSSCGGGSQYVNIHEERRFEEILPPQEIPEEMVQEQQIGQHPYYKKYMTDNNAYGGYGKNSIIWIILIIIALLIIGALFMNRKSSAPARRR